MIVMVMSIDDVGDDHHNDDLDYDYDYGDGDMIMVMVMIIIMITLVIVTMTRPHSLADISSMFSKGAFTHCDESGRFRILVNVI